MDKSYVITLWLFNLSLLLTCIRNTHLVFHKIEALITFCTASCWLCWKPFLNILVTFVFKSASVDIVRVYVAAIDLRNNWHLANFLKTITINVALHILNRFDKCICPKRGPDNQWQWHLSEIDLSVYYSTAEISSYRNASEASDKVRCWVHDTAIKWRLFTVKMFINT